VNKTEEKKPKMDLRGRDKKVSAQDILIEIDPDS
jgi:hypothetical protein